MSDIGKPERKACDHVCYHRRICLCRKPAHIGGQAKTSNTSLECSAHMNDQFLFPNFIVDISYLISHISYLISRISYLISRISYLISHISSYISTILVDISFYGFPSSLRSASHACSLCTPLRPYITLHSTS